jgi:hypothetical protein
VGGNNGVASVEVLDLGRSPLPVPDYPHPVSQAVGAFFNNEVVVCGGYSHPATFYEDCYAIGTNGDAWKEKPSLNHPRKGKFICTNYLFFIFKCFMVVTWDQFYVI